MLGFSDLNDHDLVTAFECARRLGFSSVETMRRALRRKGGALPRPFLRGRYRAADLKDWLLAFDAASRHNAFFPQSLAAPTVHSLDAARLRRKLAANA